ncbi:MAG: Hsp70 family protein, partial [Nitrosomonas sp.]|nr:Hsp70 family protein [Nitrosomonas sp.]
EDHKALELISSRNQCDAMIHSVKKSLKEHGDQLDGDEKSKIEAALKDAEDVLKTDKKEDIDAKTQALTEAAHKLAEKMYQQKDQPDQQAQPGAAGSSSSQHEKPVEGEVVDAEFEEVKNKK